MKIIPNTAAVKQDVGQSRIVVNGTDNTFKPFAGYQPKVIHVGTYTFAASAEVGSTLKCTLQKNENDSGWNDVDGMSACRNLRTGDKFVFKISFNVPYYDGILANTKISYRVVAECPSGSVSLHYADGWLVKPTGVWRTQYNFDGLPPVTVYTVSKVGSPSGSGAAWTENNNINVQFVPIDGNRFVWHSRNSNAGRARTDNLVGQVDATGNYSYGSLTVLDNAATSSLSANTYCITGVGNNKFVRIRGLPNSFDFYDCGGSGLSISLAATAQGAITGFRGIKNQLICNIPSGKLGLMSDNIGSFPNYTNALYVYNVNNVANAIGTEVPVANVWGENGRILHYDSPECFTISPAQNGFLMCGYTAINTADRKMVMTLTSFVTTLDIYNFADTSARPIALRCQDDGVFLLAYISSTGVIKLQCGKVVGSAITLGNSVNYRDGLVFYALSFMEAGIQSNGSGLFAFALQDTVTNAQSVSPIYTDGTDISYDDTKRISYSLGSRILTMAQSGFANKFLIGNYGLNAPDFPLGTERYTSMIEVAQA